jgi:hypothetical protein
MPMMTALLAGPLGKFLFFGGMLVTLVPIMADRSRHRPGNIAPIQWISTIGASALLLLQGTMFVVSIREGSLIVAGTSFATLLTTIVLFLRDGANVVDSQTPETIDAMVDEIQQILGRARRTGIESVSAMIIAGSVPWIGVSVPRRGHIVVCVREDLLSWLERHRGPNGAGDAAAGSLLRFTFLHELGHVLNGDHLTYRFVRSVLVAHLWWVAAAASACVMLLSGGASARDALVACLCLLPPFLAQCLLARRFLAEREEDADLRAMQTLDPADVALLTRRKPERWGPTLLERLMTDLHVQTPLGRPAIQPLSRAVQWIWPETGRIRERSELVVGGYGGRVAEPHRWAAWMGMQCGLLSASLVAAFGTSLPVTLIVMALICSMAATYCGIRVDPALVRLHDIKRVPTRRTVGVVFYLSFSASALLLYLLPPFSGPLPYSLFALAVGASAPQVFFGTFAAAAIAAGDVDDAARALRHPVLRAGPSIFISLAIIVGCSMAAAWCFGVAWQGPAMVTFAAVTISIVSSRSTNATVRAIAPIAMLDSPGNIYAIRIFWREIYFDRAVTPDISIGIIGLSTYTAIALFSASGAALAAKVISVVASEEVVFRNLFLMSVVLSVLLSRIPKRDRTTAQLFDLEHVQMFELLLAAVWTARPAMAGKLSEALVLWVKSDAGLPDAVLPEPRSLWKLEALLPLIRIARAVGEEETLARWRDPIVRALRGIISGGAVSLKGRRPSLGYTVLAAHVVDEANLASQIPLEPMLDSIAEQLEEWLNGRIGAAAGPVASACRLLAAHGRAQPGPDRIRMRSVMAVEFMLTRPIVRKAVGELAAYTGLLEDTKVQDDLANIVRSRLWEVLQLNPGNDPALLLDCYLAAVSLGETDSPRLAIAESVIEEITESMVEELTKVCLAMPVKYQVKSATQ